MNASESFSYLYKLIARGLEHYWGGDVPLRFHLLAPLLPKDDRVCLARALCKMRAIDATTFDVRVTPIDDVQVIPIDEVQDVTGKFQPGFQGVAVIDGRSQFATQIEAECDESSNCPENVVTVDAQEDDSSWPVLRFDAIEMSDIVADALDALFRELGQPVSALARTRFENNGFDGLSGFLSAEDVVPRKAANFELFYHRLSRAWRFDGKNLNANGIADWVNQFEKFGFERQARDMLAYLQRRGYTAEDAVIERLRGIYRDVSQSCVGPTYCVSIQEIGKSEGKLAYRLRPDIQMESVSEVIDKVKIGGGVGNVFCFDDCVLSGESILKYLFCKKYNSLSEDLIELMKNGKLKIFVISHDLADSGKQYIEKSKYSFGNIYCNSYRRIREEDRAFSNNSVVISQKYKNNDNFMKFCSRIGEEILEGSPFGWDNGQLCICYDYTIPDNSLPVLWGASSGDVEWLPLFERNRE